MKAKNSIDLSDKIFDSALKIVEQWLKDNPDFPTLDLVQQINLSAVSLKYLSGKYESEYKALIKVKITNDIH